MLYLYNDEAGSPLITLKGDDHRYIFRVRRHRVDDILSVRNLKDGLLHSYTIKKMDRQSTTLIFKKSEIHDIKAKESLHIGWCIIDPKSVEKALPTLNEMGVDKITFIYCGRSQNSFKLDFQRLAKIVINSSQQSGRTQIMKMDLSKNLKEFIKEYPDTYLLNFSQNKLSSSSNIDTIVVGCEGGLTDEEVALFNPNKIVGFNTPLVLKSESAVSGVASKLLL